MCIFGTSNQRVNQTQTQSPAFRDAPPVVTGSQIGVDNPKDTKRVTEELKIKRQKKEGTYEDPNTKNEEQSVSQTQRRKNRFKVVKKPTGGFGKVRRNTNIRRRLGFR